jgi:hypothetical protein
MAKKNFFYQSGDSLDTTTAGQTADCWLCDALDVVTQDFAMALGASLPKSFASFSSSGHFCCSLVVEFEKLLSLL